MEQDRVKIQNADFLGNMGCDPGERETRYSPYKTRERQETPSDE